MSQENVEFVRTSFGIWTAGDMDAYRELLDPDFVMYGPKDWPEGSPMVGRDAAMRQFVNIREAFDFDRAEPVSEFIDVGAHVVSRFAWKGLGHGPPSNMEMSCVYLVENGRMRRMDFFFDHAEALEAVGLSE